MSTTAPEKPTTNNTPSAPASPTVIVAKQINGFLERGTLVLPKDYSVDNALKSAWFALQDVEGWKTCTPESVQNALLDMCVQGMNVAKKQGYFIKYGNKLIFQRSYFGDMALAERVCPGLSLFADVIYEGEEIKVSKVRTIRGLVTVIQSHEQPFPRSTKKMLGAYCGAVDGDGNALDTVVMDIQQIERSWNQGATKGKSPAHQGFPDQMALRTVIRRRCKPIINTSSDKILLDAIKRQEMDQAEGEMDAEIDASANGEVITLEPQAELPAPSIPAQDEERIGKAPVDEQPVLAADPF